MVVVGSQVHSNRSLTFSRFLLHAKDGTLSHMPTRQLYFTRILWRKGTSSRPLALGGKCWGEDPPKTESLAFSDITSRERRHSLAHLNAAALLREDTLAEGRFKPTFSLEWYMAE